MMALLKTNHTENIGKIFGNLKILDVFKNNKYYIYKYECHCGNKSQATSSTILNNKIKSCGCSQYTNQIRTKSRSDIKIGIESSSVNYVFLNYKRSAKLRKHSFELTKEQFYNICIQNCIYCGTSPTKKAGSKNKKNTPLFEYNGIDRKDNTIGYTIENSVPCCFICNRAKGNLNENEWSNWINNFSKYKNNSLGIINNNMIVVCDIDDTLLMYNETGKPKENSLKILHPLTNTYDYPIPHLEHIKLLKAYKAQGYTILLWSAQGFEWVIASVNALKINEIVDIKMSKPLKYIDDLKGPEGILGSRVYIEFDSNKKIIESGNQE